jgi:hypothetical protein
MKVYIVTAGDYSYYHIEKVFSSMEKARAYALLDPDRDVEVFDMDKVDVQMKKSYVLVQYDYLHKEMISIEAHNTQVKPRIDKQWPYAFKFTVDLSNIKLRKSIIRYGKSSGMLNKIAQDTLAQYLYEHDTTAEELHQKEWEKRNQKKYPYIMYTSSIYDTPPEKINPVNAELTDYVNKCIDENGQAPDIMNLIQQMYNKETEETNK